MTRLYTTSSSLRVGRNKFFKAITGIIAPVLLAVQSCVSGESEKPHASAELQGWGQPIISVACMREEPRHGSELVSQCLLGEPVVVTGRDGEWLEIETAEGYCGWVNESSIVEKRDDEMALWRKAERYVVDSPYEIRVYADSSLDAACGVVTDLVDGCIVEGSVTRTPGVLAVTLPDGRSGYADRRQFMEIVDWSNQAYSVEKIISRAKMLMGVPYLWGGLSTKSMDCSGLVKLCYRANGIIVRRDASQQALCGIKIDRDSLERGDLLFFGNEETGRVTHVGIYEGDNMYVHSSGRVRRNSLDRESADYIDKHYLSSRRYGDAVGSEGITRVKDHAWFF